MKRKRRVPVSNLRASLGEKIRDREESPVVDWHDEFSVKRPSLLRLLFGAMNRYLKLKVSVAVAVVFLCALLQYADIPWLSPVTEGLRYVTAWDIDLQSVAGRAVPAFKLALSERNLPHFTVNPLTGRGELLPFDGRVTGGYGIRTSPHSQREEMYYGIDLAAPKGTKVKAVLAGMVGKVSSEEGSASLQLEHDSGWQTFYRGLEGITVSSGDLVREGQVLGVLGTSAEGISPCLYFELRHRGYPVEPPAEWVNQFADG